MYEPFKTDAPKLLDAPENLVGWMRRHPYLRTSEPERVEVGGAKGERVDVVVEDLPEDYLSVTCGADCVDVWKSSSGLARGQYKEDESRVVVLEDVEGEPVTIVFGSRAGDFDEFAPEARNVIDTVEWGDG